MKLKVFVLLTLALSVFSTPVLVTMNVSAQKFSDVSCNIIKNTSLPVQPCGDPIDDEPDLPH